jgi:hypothetical protein
MANGDEVATHRVTPTDILYPVDIPHLAA